MAANLKMRILVGERLIRRGWCVWQIGESPRTVVSEFISFVRKVPSGTKHDQLITSSRRFFITLAPCPHLNTKHTVFGHVVSGLDILHRMAKVPVDSKDRPLTEIIISHCGELERRKKAPIPPSQHQTSTRGRRHPTRSPSSSRSPSPHGHHNKTALPSSRPPRRKSDFALDETRRGRTLTRSPSPHALSPSPPRKRRKRSLPPSRSHSRHSRSPHLRRRHTKSRSRSLRREKRGRDEGRGRREADATNARYNGRHDGHERGFRSAGYWDRDDERDGFNGHGGDGRLDDPGDLGGNVKFKGRGSMKYREKKW